MGCDGELRRIAREALTTRPNFAYTLDEVKVGWRGLDAGQGCLLLRSPVTGRDVHSSKPCAVAWRAHTWSTGLS